MYFDLIGLPPTPEEVEAFVHDPAPDAYARLVERLLASPHHGERWARYWLDLARYCDVAEPWAENKGKAYLDGIHRQVPDGLIFMVSLELDLKCYGRFTDKPGKREQHFAWIDARGQLSFASRPQDAPITHFGGPLSLRLTPSQKLSPGQAEEVRVNVGTPGLGAGSFVTTCHGFVPKGIHPAVEVRFPPNAPGKPPVVLSEILRKDELGAALSGL